MEPINACVQSHATCIARGHTAFGADEFDGERVKEGGTVGADEFEGEGECKIQGVKVIVRVWYSWMTDR